MKIELSALAALALVAAAANSSPLAASADVRPYAGPPISDIGGSAPGGADQCVDHIQVAPVLQMTHAGYTLTGPVMRSLHVDSSGLVIMSEQNPAGGGSSAQMFHVGPDRVRALAIQLEELEADSLCDARTQVYDVPLTTVTVFSGGADSRAHSYSYWLAEGGQRLVEEEITRFIMDVALREETAKRK